MEDRERLERLAFIKERGIVVGTALRFDPTNDETPKIIKKIYERTNKHDLHLIRFKVVGITVNGHLTLGHYNTSSPAGRVSPRNSAIIYDPPPLKWEEGDN